MDIVRENVLQRRVSWGSILAGVVTVLAISILLTTLGTSLGLSMLSPKSDDIINGADKTVIIWSVVSIVFSLACGGFVSGRLAGADGTIHGFLSWASSLLVASLLGFALAGGILNMAGSAIGSVASATGSVVSGLGSAAGKTASGALDVGKNIAERLGLDTQLSNQDTDKQVLDALKKSNIKELQPEFLQSQLQAAGKDLAQSVKELVVNPGNSDAIIDSLNQKLKSRVDTVSKNIDPNEVKKALADNTQLTPDEANSAVDNFIQGRKNLVDEFNQRMNELEKNLNDAKAQYADLKQKAKEKADEAARVGAKISLWSFIGLLVGAIVSAFAGLWGVNTHPEIRKIRA
ncbi:MULTISPECIES: CAP-Gly protein [unclassified Pantoea]|uniref:CAP-Gly protein n=1 Tax=unclassified Pantoea TaxID=2630326 RepID=UPI001CD35BCC|nr:MULTISPECIES: CAP-Gly protein [unclassified Pantoea]MCA1179812.1 CAP-Gly protein [Pantoea sp. alder69]MCA1253586.1 CAP-Gly protein [Pantoea sp. alder70]MCA1268298.1 CAP-Gly protein [Pantoea sp. alder81]